MAYPLFEDVSFSYAHLGRRTATPHSSLFPSLLTQRLDVGYYSSCGFLYFASFVYPSDRLAVYPTNRITPHHHRNRPHSPSRPSPYLGPELWDRRDGIPVICYRWHAYQRRYIC